MVYDIKNSHSGSLLDWLSDNHGNAYGGKNNVRRQERRFPLLMQSFKSAGRAFQAIDAPTQALIVPYGSKGRRLIAKLCGEYEPKAFYRYLRQAQQYSVNVFPHVWRKLEGQQAIREVIAGTGIYYLNERYYSAEYGLSTNEINEMVFYNL